MYLLLYSTVVCSAVVTVCGSCGLGRVQDPHGVILLAACFLGVTDVVRILLASGADLNLRRTVRCLLLIPRRVAGGVVCGHRVECSGVQWRLFAPDSVVGVVG